jgi:hypothetical protein
VLPFYEEHGVEIEHILTDNGRETCGKPLSHPFELYLTIPHTKGCRPFQAFVDGVAAMRSETGVNPEAA